MLKYSCILFLGLLPLVLMGQQYSKRAEIDQKRMAVDISDPDALTMGREFVRMDSTYYVGWMLQGLFLDDRSADRTGYQNAIPYLRTAFVLLDKEYNDELSKLYSSFDFYINNFGVYRDYLGIGQALRECYEYIDMPDSAMWVLNNIQEKKFIRDEFGLYGSKAWIIHRNRFYTDGRYDFLSNNVNQNVHLALQSCYNGFGNISKNESKTLEWFGPYASEVDKQYLFHYLAMIHSYLQQYDSSEYYYNLMAALGTISYNNYGSLKHEVGEFETATQLYQIEKDAGAPDKRLREPFYYIPLLKLYAGNTADALKIANEAISFSQSMPGFGWYNIALARSYLYNGQLDSAEVALNKAANYKEVHIGTTLTQPQYDFTISLLRFIWYSKKMTLVKLMDKGWWYKPSKWYEMATLWAKRYTNKYLLANQLSENPERQRAIYDLFCGESTISFDEIYYLMKAVSPEYFASLMEEKKNMDPRLKVTKYFELAEAAMHIERGRIKKANSILKALLQTVDANDPNEKLFMARVYEMLAATAPENKKQDALNKMFTAFPELVPYAGQPLSIALQINGDDPEQVNMLKENLEKTSIQWKDITNTGIPAASIYIQNKGNKYELTIQTQNADNKKMVENEKVIYRNGNDITEDVLLRIFGKKGAVEPDYISTVN